MSSRPLRIRRIVASVIVVVTIITAVIANSDMWQPVAQPAGDHGTSNAGSAEQLLATIAIKGRAAKTGYARTEFGNGWQSKSGCDTRNIILHRDLQNPVVGDDCKVQSGTLNDPYTGNMIPFKKGVDSSADVQIDHIVALSDSWQKGAQQLTKEQRVALANDPLELLAVDGKTNQDKGDGDAATWLPPNKSFRCQYVARQIAVKAKYHLWMTQAEHDAIGAILARCPNQSLPSA